MTLRHPSCQVYSLQTFVNYLEDINLQNNTQNFDGFENVSLGITFH